MSAIKKFSQGVDNNTFKGVGYLLWLNIKKQIALWVFVGLIVLAALIGIVSSIMAYKSSTWMTVSILRFDVRALLIAGTLLPLSFITLFSIPSTLNAMHKTTLIKRIGATRLTEESFIMLVSIWYTIISLAVVTILFFGMITISRMFGTSDMQLLDNMFKAYIISIFVVLLMVNMGVLLGTMPISQILVISISIVLFILSVLFGGFLMPVTNGFAVWIPTFTRWAVIINPFGFSSYTMASILTDGYGIGTTLISIIYMLSLTLLCFCGSSLAMNFNKIK